MPRTIKIPQLLAATALSVSLTGELASASWPPPSNVLNCTLNVVPSDPYIGESTRVRLEGNGGIAAPNALKDIAFFTNVGEASAVYQNMPSKDATVAKGRFFIHAWESAGQKDLITNAWAFDGDTHTQNYSVQVQDPDAPTVPWFLVLWIDISATPSTALMPLEDAVNKRITSLGQLLTYSRDFGGTGQRVRMRWRNGVTHNWSSGSFRFTADVSYIDGFDSGAPYKILDTRASYAQIHWFEPDFDDLRVIFANGNAESPFDPITGEYGAGRIDFFSTEGHLRPLVSFFRFGVKGMRALWRGTGGNDVTKDYRPAMYDCWGTDWNDYGGAFSGSCFDFYMRGCNFAQNELAGLGDAKPNPMVFPDWSDHNPVRVSRSRYGAISDCFLGSTGGWSPYGTDTAGQHCARVYMDSNPEGSQFLFLYNETVGRSMLEFGHASRSDAITNAGAEILIDGNKHTFIRQGAVLVFVHVGGYYVQNNTARVPNLSTARTDRPYTIVNIVDFYDPGAAPEFSQAAWQKPAYVGFNTYLSQATAALDPGADQITEVDFATHNGISQVVTVEHNFRAGDFHTGTGYVPAAAFSLGDNLRPITGGAAVSTVTSGPPADASGIKRAGATNIGAHHAPGANVGVASAVNVSAPTIAVNTGKNAAQVIDVGTWTGVPYAQWEFNWRRNGVAWPTAGDVEDTHATVHNLAGVTTEEITCLLVGAGRDGSRASGLSNVL